MKKIGRYIVRGILGYGGMGKVYKVELPTIGKIAALKHFNPDPLVVQLMGLVSLRALFTSEAVTIARLQHPNIVAIHDFDQEQGNPFFVMDFFANNLGNMMGESYRVESPSRILNPDKAIDYARQTLEGLACLHDAGITHRDIKPYNLLVTAHDIVKICDFGLSKLRGEAFSGPKNLNVGSPYYAAPEQAIDPDCCDERADIYPVGVMLYRMLTGRLPAVEGRKPGYQPCGFWNPDLDDKWDALIRRAIDPRPEARFAGADEMLSALHELESHWKARKEKSCQLTPDPLFESPPDRMPPQIRNTPLKLRPSEAARRFRVDRLWRPKTYTRNSFEIRDDGTITDHATGLMWQQAGSRYPGTWQYADTYVGDLNRRRFADRSDWRLPTINELITLLRPKHSAIDLCIAPQFDQRQRWIWSIDRRSFVAAYYIDMELGFVGWQDCSAPYYTRAVCSTPTLQPKKS
jgi:serine/threonine protein kinase